MREEGAPPFEGGRQEYGLLRILDDMCNVIDGMAHIIYDQAVALERAKIEDELRQKIAGKRSEIEEKLDEIEFRLRRR